MSILNAGLLTYDVAEGDFLLKLPYPLEYLTPTMQQYCYSIKIMTRSPLQAFAKDSLFFIIPRELIPKITLLSPGFSIQFLRRNEKRSKEARGKKRNKILVFVCIFHGRIQLCIRTRYVSTKRLLQYVSIIAVITNYFRLHALYSRYYGCIMYVKGLHFHYITVKRQM